MTAEENSGEDVAQEARKKRAEEKRVELQQGGSGPKLEEEAGQKLEESEEDKSMEAAAARSEREVLADAEQEKEEELCPGGEEANAGEITVKDDTHDMGGKEDTAEAEEDGEEEEAEAWRREAVRGFEHTLAVAQVTLRSSSLFPVW
eukprot:3699196-Rhodomonas_salina.1